MKNIRMDVMGRLSIDEPTSCHQSVMVSVMEAVQYITTTEPNQGEFLMFYNEAGKYIEVNDIIKAAELILAKAKQRAHRMG